MRLCEDCDADISRRHKNARLCESCARERKRAKQSANFRRWYLENRGYRQRARVARRQARRQPRVDKAQLAIVFGSRLRSSRLARNWTQARLTEEAGLGPMAICHFENAHILPSFITLRTLADTLDVSGDYLLGRT